MEEIIEFADAAMYEAKARGKNRLVFYSQLDGKNRWRGVLKWKIILRIDTLNCR